MYKRQLQHRGGTVSGRMPYCCAGRFRHHHRGGAARQDRQHWRCLLYTSNGIPVVVLEFKSAVQENTTIMDAYMQLTIRYRRDIPEIFIYNAFVVIRDVYKRQGLP